MTDLLSSCFSHASENVGLTETLLVKAVTNEKQDQLALYNLNCFDAISKRTMWHEKRVNRQRISIPCNLETAARTLQRFRWPRAQCLVGHCLYRKIHGRASVPFNDHQVGLSHRAQHSEQ